MEQTSIFLSESIQNKQKALSLNNHQLGLEILDKIWADINVNDYRAALLEAAIDRLCIRCPDCRSVDTSRFQWVDGFGYQYWTCWDCDSVFMVNQ